MKGCDEGSITIESNIDVSLLDISWIGETYAGQVSYTGSTIADLLPGRYEVTVSLSGSADCSSTGSYIIDACQISLQGSDPFDQILSETVDMVSQAITSASSRGTCDARVETWYDDPLGYNQYTWYVEGSPISHRTHPPVLLLKKKDDTLRFHAKSLKG